ncbi:hypothetical protein EPUL_004483, partial [Erysiphe pulchra]
MQDNAPTHAAANTMEERSQRLIQPIFWSSIFSDLNPIEDVLDRMKDQIQRHNPNLGSGRQRTQDSLCLIVKQAWDSLSSENLVRLIESMPAGYKA